METELLRDDTIHSRSASMNYSKIVSSQEIINNMMSIFRFSLYLRFIMKQGLIPKRSKIGAKR